MAATAPYTPTVAVEVAFGFGAYDVPGFSDWVDITEDAYEIHIARGRQSELDQFPAGTAVVSLYNDQRQYDPLNTAGDYYGQLVANVPIRIRATVGLDTYTVWRGYVDGWPATYTEAGARAELNLQCTDAFKTLAERPMPDTHRAFLENFGPPDSWYRCDSVANLELVNDGTIGRTGRVVTSASIDAGLVPVSTGSLSAPAQSAVAFPDFAYIAELPISLTARDNLTEGAVWTISAVALFAQYGFFRGIFDTFASADLTANQVVTLSNSSLLTAGTNFASFIIDYGAGFLVGQGGPNLGDGRVHRLVLVRDTTTAYLYVDGQLADSDFNAAATGAFDCTGGVHIIGRTYIGPDVSPVLTVDELMAWKNRALTAAEVADLDAELVAGFGPVQTSGAAVIAVLDAIGWPSTLRAVDDGEVLVKLPGNPVGQSTLAVLQNIAACEGGRLFVSRFGLVTFHGRSRFVTETTENTVQYEFSDIDRDDPVPPDVGLQDGTLSITVDDRLTYDAAQVTREGGLAQTSSLTATPARTFTADGLYLTDDHQALSLAQWIPFRFGTAQPRSESWVVNPEVRPADWGAMFGLEIGHRIRHDLTPGGIGSSIQLEQHLSVIGHDITTEQWTVTLNGTPVDPNEAAYFVWHTDGSADDDNGWGDIDGTPPGGYWG